MTMSGFVVFLGSTFLTFSLYKKGKPHFLCSLSAEEEV